MNYLSKESICKISTILIFLLFSKICEGQITAASSGNWSSPSTWVGGIVPGDGDVVIINTPNNVTISVAETHNANITGSGILTVQNVLSINSNITISVSTLNNIIEITGTGTKTYNSGVTINNTNGTLGGGEHILSNGAILNSITFTIISSTTLTNHGVFNLQSGNVSGTSNNTFFVNESDGIVNVNAPSTNLWTNLNFTNKGSFNKVSNTITRFNNNFGTGTFINDVGVTLSIAAGQEIQFLNTATLNGTISNSGTLSFNALCTLNGALVNNGTWNITSAPTINLGSAISGTGILNVNNSFAIPYDITFNFNTVNNNSEIIGTGKKTYASGVTINNTNGTLGGGEHILSNGAILNSITSTIISSTTLTNHGVFNLQSGNISGTINNTFFVNESDGIVNVNAPGTNQWSNLNFTNKGSFNKVTNTITRFNNNFGTGTFINDVGVTLSIAAGQEIQFLNTATLNGTISNSGILSFNALCTLNGSLINNGTWNITSAPTINLGSAISGTGILNVNNSFSIPYDITFTFITINNNNGIIGTGKKTYASGVTINNNNGTLGGGEHILSNGAILNANTFTIISSTTLTNHGVFNLQSGNISGVSNNTFFVNENDGIVNVNAPGTNQWSNLNFTNKGLFNKVSNTITQFNNNFGTGTFINDAGVTLSIAAGQEIQFFNTATLNGTISNSGILSFNANCTLNGALVNNGTWNITSAPTINLGSAISGTGILNVNNSFSIPYDITFTFITINNNNGIIGTGKKTYASGVTINNNNGTLGGGEHILSNGAILNANTFTIISSTTLTNHGVFNLQSGNISGVSNNTFFVNENDGIVNVNAPGTNQWSNLNFTNKGLFNKVSNTITQFNNNFGTGNFNNDLGGNIKGIGTVSHMNTYAYLSGSAISPGASPGLLTVISSTSPLNYGLSTYNCEINGTTAITQHDQLSSSGQVNLSQMSLNVIWGFTPIVGQSFTIMNHSSIIGEFSNVTIPNIANYVYKIDYNPTNVILHVYLRFYEDFDQDTYGNANIFQNGPTAPVNFVLDNSDCDDTNSAINPAATEVCDLIDNDCDGDVDEGVLITYYADADMDTYGDPAVPTMACSAPLGYVANNNDCNDNDANEKPNQIWYIDADNDTYGNSSVVQCLRPLNGFLLTELAIGSSGLDDCDDMDMSLYPNSPSNIVTSVAPGNWTNNTTWQCGIPLTQADSVFIYNPVYLDDTISIIADIVIEGFINSGKLTIGANQILTIGSPSQLKELKLKPNSMLIVDPLGKLIIYGKLLAHPNALVDNNGIIEIK